LSSPPCLLLQTFRIHILEHNWIILTDFSRFSLILSSKYSGWYKSAHC
jgi:hypothetical protein